MSIPKRSNNTLLDKTKVQKFQELNPELKLQSTAIQMNFNAPVAVVMNSSGEQPLKQLPIVKGEQQVLFADSISSNTRWFRKELQLDNLQDNFFCTEVVNTGIENGEISNVYGCKIIIPYVQVHSATSREKWAEVKSANAAAELKEIPLHLNTVYLKLKWQDSQQNTREEQFPGLIDQINQRVEFDLIGEMCKNAYFILAKGFGEATVCFSLSFEGYSRLDQSILLAAKKTEQLNAFVMRVPFWGNVKNLDLEGQERKEVHRLKKDKPFDQFMKKVNVVSHSFLIKYELPLHAPCDRYGSIYKLMGNGLEQPIYCSEPWKSNIETGLLYKQIFPAGISSMPGSIYQSLAQPDTYVIVPNAYVIARTVASNYAPLVDMTSILDAEQSEENYIDFQFSIAPKLSSFDLLSFERAIQTHMHLAPSRSINIIYPTDIGKKQELLMPEIPGISFSGMPDGRHFIINLRTSNLHKAKLILDRIKNAGLFGQINIVIDALQVVSANLSLNLNETIGEVIDAESDVSSSKVISVQNRSESEVQINRFAQYDQEGKIIRITEFSEPWEISAEETEEFDLEYTLQPEEKIIFDFTIIEDPAKELSERRIHVQELERIIVFVADGNPSNLNISYLTINTEFTAAELTESIKIFPNGDGDSWEHGYLKLILPLDRYLQPESQFIKYQVEVHLTDSVDSIKGEWEMLNFVSDGNTVVFKESSINQLVSDHA